MKPYINKNLALLLSIVVAIFFSVVLNYAADIYHLEKYRLLIILISYYFVYVLYRLLTDGYIKKIYFYLSIILYFLFLVAILFTKQGGYPIILNPLSFLSIEYSYLENLANLLVFIPLFWLKSYYKIYSIIIYLSFFVIEIIQDFLKVGVFDMGDVFLYFLSYIIGYFAYKLVFSHIKIV